MKNSGKATWGKSYTLGLPFCGLFTLKGVVETPLLSLPLCFWPMKVYEAPLTQSCALKMSFPPLVQSALCLWTPSDAGQVEYVRRLRTTAPVCVRERKGEREGWREEGEGGQRLTHRCSQASQLPHWTGCQKNATAPLSHSQSLTRFGIGFQPFGSNRVFLTAGERACFPVFLLSTLSWSSSTAGIVDANYSWRAPRKLFFLLA